MSLDKGLGFALHLPPFRSLGLTAGYLDTSNGSPETNGTHFLRRRCHWRQRKINDIHFGSFAGGHC